MPVTSIRTCRLASTSSKASISDSAACGGGDVSTTGSDGRVSSGAGGGGAVGRRSASTTTVRPSALTESSFSRSSAGANTSAWGSSTL